MKNGTQIFNARLRHDADLVGLRGSHQNYPRDTFSRKNQRPKVEKKTPEKH